MSRLSSGKIKSPGHRQNRALRFKTQGASLGLAASRTDQLINQVQGGFSFKTLVCLEAATGIPVAEIATIIGLPERTLARRRAAGKLAPDESERLLRIATVFEKAVNLFEGDVHAAVAWLRKPRKALAHQTPLAYSRTGIGAREVEDLIGRLEYGVFS